MGSRPLPPALALLSGERNCAADAALLEALPHLESHARSTAVEMVVRRAHAPTLTALVLRFGDYDDDLKNAISRRIGGLHAPTRAAVASDIIEERASAIDLIRASGDGKLAYLLADALRSPCQRTRELAAHALHDMTARMVDGLDAPPQPGVDALDSQADALAEALRTAVQRWELHFQPRVLEAALWMGERTESAILAKMEEPHTKIVHALGEIIESASDPRIAGAVVRALAIPALRPAAARALAHVRNPVFLQSLARHCWLLADPEIEHGCRWVQEGRWVDEWLAGARQIAEPQAAGVIRILGATGGTNEKKMERFRVLFDSRGDELRRAVLWQVIGDSSRPATDFLTMIAARSGDEIAEIAARECRRRRPETAVQSVAGRAALRGVREGDAFEAFFEGFDRLAPAERTSLAEGIKGSVIGLTERIRDKCASPIAMERCRAVRVAKMLGVLDDLANDIYQLAHDGEAVVRGVAVGALAKIPGPTTSRILRTAVNDPDARVQANAIEALDRLNVEDRLSYIKAKLSSPHNRVRANAVRALLRIEICEAGEVLLEMLEDSSKAHRLSALWVVERMRLRSMFHRILDISRNDPDERVRRRAQRVLPELNEQMLQRAAPIRPATGGRSFGQVGSA